LDLAIDDACREILEHHAAIVDVLSRIPWALNIDTKAYFIAFSMKEELRPAARLNLRAYQFDPTFLWAPSDARIGVFIWAHDAFIVQLAASTSPFMDLPDDCAGDILKFFPMIMRPRQTLYITTHSASKKARVWLREVVQAAVAVSICSMLLHYFSTFEAYSFYCEGHFCFNASSAEILPNSNSHVV